MADRELSLTDERAFIERIDCRFPYSDLGEASALMEVALALSANASCMVVYELACPPQSQRVVTRDQRRKLLDLFSERFHHPLAVMILDVARRLIAEQMIMIAESIAHMKLVESFPNQYCALNIASSSLADDPDGLLDQEFERIVRSWTDRIAIAE